MISVVTGGTGFLGTHLVRLLQRRGATIRVFLRPGTSPAPADIETRLGDIRDLVALRAAFAGASTVFHLAGLVAPFAPRHRHLAINVDGTAAVLDACQAVGVSRLVYVSSMVVLGIERDRRGLTEDAPYATTFAVPYEESKVKAEMLVRDRARETGLPVVVMRPGMGWGPGERVFLPHLVHRLASPLFFMVGNGKNTLDLSYASNVAHALWLGATRPEAVGRIYNVADGFGITCREFLSALAAALGLPAPRRRLPRALVAPLLQLLTALEPEPKGDRLLPSRAAMMRLCALYRDSEPDTSRLRKELGYNPPVDFKSGIAKTVAWYRNAFPEEQAG